MSWFESNGVRLRSVEVSDTDTLFDYLNLDEMYADRQFDSSGPWPVTRAEIEECLQRASETSRTFVIETGGTIVGHVALDWWWDALQPWMGVAVAPRHRRRGYGRRAATMVLDYLFDQTPAHVVVADAGDWNEIGMRFAEAMGFSAAGRYRHTVKRDGRWRDTVTFDLLQREWEAHRAAVE